jgi:hypothetical protein
MTENKVEDNVPATPPPPPFRNVPMTHFASQTIGKKETQGRKLQRKHMTEQYSR